MLETIKPMFNDYYWPWNLKKTITEKNGKEWRQKIAVDVDWFILRLLLGTKSFMRWKMKINFLHVSEAHSRTKHRKKYNKKWWNVLQPTHFLRSRNFSECYCHQKENLRFVEATRMRKVYNFIKIFVTLKIQFHISQHFVQFYCFLKRFPSFKWNDLFWACFRSSISLKAWSKLQSLPVWLCAPFRLKINLRHFICCMNDVYQMMPGHNFHFHMLLTNKANNFFSIIVSLPVFDAPPMSDMLRRLTNPIRNVRFSGLFWSIFAVERLEHAIVLWKLLVCKLCSPSDKSGAFFALDSVLTRRGFSFLSDVERSNFHEPSLRRRVYAYVSHSIDISRDILTSFGTWVRDRLKNVKSLSGGNVERACSYLMLQRHSIASSWYAQETVTDFREILGRVAEAGRDACTAKHVIYQSHRIL